MKLLLAVDGSKYADAAAQAVAASLQSRGTEALVLEVVTPRMHSAAPASEPDQDRYVKEELDLARKNVERDASVLRAAGFQVQTRVVEGEPRTAIIDMAAEWRADLIVMGSHGRNGIERFLLGSVAQSVAQHAYTSVLIVRAPAKP